MAAEEEVTSPDQHKPGATGLARVGADGTAAFVGVPPVGLLAMLCGNHKGRIEDIFLIGTAALLAGMLVGDWLLRKNGLK